MAEIKLWGLTIHTPDLLVRFPCEGSVSEGHGVCVCVCVCVYLLYLGYLYISNKRGQCCSVARVELPLHERTWLFQSQNITVSYSSIGNGVFVWQYFEQLRELWWTSKTTHSSRIFVSSPHDARRRRRRRRRWKPQRSQVWFYCRH